MEKKDKKTDGEGDKDKQKERKDGGKGTQVSTHFKITAKAPVSMSEREAIMMCSGAMKFIPRRRDSCFSSVARHGSAKWREQQRLKRQNQ